MAGKVLVELRVAMRSLEDAHPGDLRLVSGDLASYLTVNGLGRRLTGSSSIHPRGRRALAQH